MILGGRKERGWLPWTLGQEQLRRWSSGGNVKARIAFCSLFENVKLFLPVVVRFHREKIRLDASLLSKEMNALYICMTEA